MCSRVEAGVAAVGLIPRNWFVALRGVSWIHIIKLVKFPMLRLNLIYGRDKAKFGTLVCD
jgi:hypothetical protein